MAAKKHQTFDVFVGNLPTESNEKNVGKLFTPYGEITGVLVKESAKVKGPYNKFAFVKFLCQQDADRAVKEMNRKKIDGSEIVVKISEDRRGYNKHNDKFKNPPMSSDTDPADSGGGMAFMPQSQGMSQGDANLEKPTPNMQDSAILATGLQVKDTVMITHVESPITLWLQVVNDENTQKIFSITDQLSSLCPTATHLTGQPEPGKVYGCLFTEDTMWYRCQVRQNFGADKYKIQYIDYGNTEEVSAGSLVEIPASLANVKGLAIKVILHNTRANDLNDKKAIQYLKSLTDNQMAQLIKTRSLADGTGFYGNMYVNEVSLSDSMMQAGFCLAKPQMHTKKMPLGGSMNAGGAGEGFQETGMGQPGPQMMGASMFATGGPRQGMKGNQRELRNTISPVPNNMTQQPQASQNMAYQMKMGQQQNSGQEKKLQNELTKKRQENERLKNEKDAVHMQLDFMKSKIKTLQDEFAASAAKLQEDTLSKRINSVLGLAGVVRKLREQFPTGSKPCLLEDAIKMSSNEDRVDISKCRSLAEVGSTLTCYKAAQNEIGKCKDQGDIKELVQARDEARQQLYEKLNVCLEEMDRMPLTARAKQVEDLQAVLACTYSDYMKIQVQDCPNLENMLPCFETWKAKKDQEFMDIRTATNFCEEALQTTLSQVKHKISVQSLESVEKSDVDIGDLMKTYSHALQREINITDMVHSKDANLITTFVASVRKELQNESSAIENFTILRQEFMNQKLSIEPWLEKTPSFCDMQENRKQLRSLKSKLRHLQADKLDLEESGDEEELDTIKLEEDKIRADIQHTLCKMETLVNDVAALASSNFPELRIQYPDLGIDSYLAYKGLVKANRDINHYNLSPGFRPGVHISTFNGEQVLLQEFHVGDSEHCSKDDFVKQVVKYNADKNIVQAVFYSKSERLAYVQSSWSGGERAETACKSREFTDQQRQEICIAMVREVISVHGREFIHGEISPQSVIIREDNSICLMYPDFSKQWGERIGKQYVTESGIVFQSPETQFSTADALGVQADVYNLVLFIFWLHYPDQTPSSMAKITKMNPSLKMLFERVLSGKTAGRVNAEQIMELDYFCKPLPEPRPSPVPSPAPVEVPSAPQHAPSIVSPEVTVTPQQPPFIVSTDQPMEIGVFRAEDYMTEPVALPPGEPITSAADTDNSWTTESSLSGTSSSRENSPLDTGLMEKSDSQHTVTGEDEPAVDGTTPSKVTVEDQGSATDDGAAVNKESPGEPGPGTFSQDSVLTPTQTEPIPTPGECGGDTDMPTSDNTVSTVTDDGKLTTDNASGDSVNGRAVEQSDVLNNTGAEQQLTETELLETASELTDNPTGNLVQETEDPLTEVLFTDNTQATVDSVEDCADVKRVDDGELVSSKGAACEEEELPPNTNCTDGDLSSTTQYLTKLLSSSKTFLTEQDRNQPSSPQPLTAVIKTMSERNGIGEKNGLGDHV